MLRVNTVLPVRLIIHPLNQNKGIFLFMSDTNHILLLAKAVK